MHQGAKAGEIMHHFSQLKVVLGKKCMLIKRNGYDDFVSVTIPHRTKEAAYLALQKCHKELKQNIIAELTSQLFARFYLIK